MAQADTTTPQTMPELTGFQRDLLFVIVSIGPAHGLGIKDEMEEYYASEVNHGRLYPNLDTLVDKGLVSKREKDKRTNDYGITERGEQTLAQRREWERKRFDGVSA